MLGACAQFPATKSLETYDFLAIPSLNKKLVVELARCEWIGRRENVLSLISLHKFFGHVTEQLGQNTFGGSQPADGGAHGAMATRRPAKHLLTRNCFLLLV